MLVQGDEGEMNYCFERRASTFKTEAVRHHAKYKTWAGPPLQTLYAGVAMGSCHDSGPVVAIAVRDTTYLVDFIEHRFPPAAAGKNVHQEIEDFVIKQLQEYSDSHMEKFIGLAMPSMVTERCPHLARRLWVELDIVPIVVQQNEPVRDSRHVSWEVKSVDELAESMARKCILFFGPNNTPLLQVGYRGLVEVDAGMHISMTELEDYERSVDDRTWAAVKYYASDLINRKVKIAFFSATPQGGGVALMRHALVRFSAVMGLDIKWYVPKPRPGVFRITKTNHNILQGVSHPCDRFTPEHQRIVSDWIEDNSKRYWTSNGGPLLAPENGGVDIIIIDDPQMPGLIPIAKHYAPDRPVIFRSHIQIRSDLVGTPGTPQAEAWEWLWDRIKLADMFISHPISAFVPANVPQEIVGYVPASTDWLDGLNKNMRDWDVAYYGRVFNMTCRNNRMVTIDYPDDQYIAQIARFDPSKGHVHVLESYAKFYNLLMRDSKVSTVPKLLLCGTGSVDDPDGSLIYDAVNQYINDKLPNLKNHICVAAVGPTDQILNALLSKARIVLQLSTYEGFEVKVSEAIHKGKPVIVTMAGGIPLQVIDGYNGFIVDVGDTDAVARDLFRLWTDTELYERMSRNAVASVSDEVSTVGNTLSWLYLASEFTKGNKIKPNGRWINDLARETAGQPYEKGENRLKRAVEVPKMRG